MSSFGGRVLFRRAVAASPEDREVRGIDDEPLVGEQPPREGVDKVGIGVTDGPARMADDMDVLVLGRPVGRCAVTEVRVPDEPDLLEQFERAVDGRDVDVVDRLADLLGSCVAEGAHRSQHLLALRRHAQAAGPQARGQIQRGSRSRLPVVVAVHLLNRR